jgi:hypothetical protein
MENNNICISTEKNYTLTFNIDIAAIKKAIVESTEIMITSVFVKFVICKYIPARVISTIYVRGLM